MAQHTLTRGPNRGVPQSCHMALTRVALTGALFTAALLAQAPGELKLSPGFDLTAIDRAAQPCNDFYQYACGTWLKNNPIPNDQASWDRFSEINENNRLILRDILEKASGAGASAENRKIGDYYAACMDEKGIDARGLAPIKPELDRIHAMKNLVDLSDEVARLHMYGVDVLFNFTSGQDFKDSAAVIGQADQAGIGLPERDYYFRDDAKAADTRKEYVAYLSRMLRLAGVAAADADARAAKVMALETALAKASLDVTTRRDPASVYHMMKLSEFEGLSDSFAWGRYFAAIKTPPLQSVNVAAPDFFKGQQALLKSEALDVWKDYFELHLLRAQAFLLPGKFDEETFGFFGKYLTGAKERKARWKRCVAATDNDLGEVLGKAYVERTFGADGKQRTLDMVKKIEGAMHRDLEELTWMTPATKQKAFEKLAAITNKIGYPDRWRDYSALRVVRGDALGNSLRANAFEFNRQLQKIGKPVDRLEWQMTPPTVNAYYDPQMNNINFPAGILQPPFFDKQQDDATNYGAIGAVIGHELSHGFDDEGRQFDAKGNFDDWWAPADAKAFDERADCLVKEYGAFELPGGVHMNGKLTLGENTADNGGLRLALMALRADLAGNGLRDKQGFSPMQRFFLGWAQAWCANETDELQRLRAQTNPHSINRFRANGVLSNMPEFGEAFSCKLNQPMVRGTNSCRVW